MQRDLVERAMAGDHEAFSELARLVIRRLYAVARLILHDTSRAEDATQEALFVAWRDLSALRDPGRFDAWVHRVLVRACHTEARRDRRRRTVEIRELPLDHHAAADELPSFVDRDQLERGFRHLSVESVRPRPRRPDLCGAGRQLRRCGRPVEGVPRPPAPTRRDLTLEVRQRWTGRSRSAMPVITTSVTRTAGHPGEGADGDVADASDLGSRWSAGAGVADAPA